MKALLWDGLKLFRGQAVSGEFPATYRFPARHSLGPNIYADTDSLDIVPIVKFEQEIYSKYRLAIEGMMHYRKEG